MKQQTAAILIFAIIMATIIFATVYFDKKGPVDKQIQEVKSEKDAFVKSDSVRRVKDKVTIDSLIQANNKLLIQIKVINNANTKGHLIDQKLIHLYDSMSVRFPRM
jgi:regulatory protein YycI of two-component signal transduction system YycFG